MDGTGGCWHAYYILLLVMTGIIPENSLRLAPASYLVKFPICPGEISLFHGEKSLLPLVQAEKSTVNSQVVNSQHENHLN